MTNKKKIIIGLQVVATVYLLGNMLYSNLQAFDLLSTAMGLLGLFGNILLAHKKSSTFALNMSNNILGGVLSFQNRVKHIQNQKNISRSKMLVVAGK